MNNNYITITAVSPAETDKRPGSANRRMLLCGRFQILPQSLKLTVKTFIADDREISSENVGFFVSGDFRCLREI